MVSSGIQLGDANSRLYFFRVCITIVGGNCISAVSIMKTREECDKFSVLARLIE